MSHILFRGMLSKVAYSIFCAVCHKGIHITTLKWWISLKVCLIYDLFFLIICRLLQYKRLNVLLDIFATFWLMFGSFWCWSKENGVDEKLEFSLGRKRILIYKNSYDLKQFCADFQPSSLEQNWNWVIFSRIHWNWNKKWNWVRICKTFWNHTGTKTSKIQKVLLPAPSPSLVYSMNLTQHHTRYSQKQDEINKQ